MRLARLVLTLAALTVAGASAAHAQVKLAFINSRELLEKAPGRAAAEASLDKELSGYRTQVQRMEDSLQTLVAQYDSTEARLTADQKTERQKAIATRQQEYRQRTQAIQQQAAQKEEELVRPIMDMIKRALDDERAAQGYTMIVDLAAQSSPVVAFDKNLDITDRVLARLATMKPLPATARPNAGAAPTTRPASGAPAGTPAGVTRPKPPTR